MQPMTKKYELTGETRDEFGITFRQIRALVTIKGVVEKGAPGGWIEREENLAQVLDTSWISGDARASGHARVFANAHIGENAHVFGDAHVYGNARVYGDSRVYGEARLYGVSRVFGNACVFGRAHVYGEAQVCGNAHVYGSSWIFGEARVYGDACVFGNARAYGDARVLGRTRVFENARVFGDSCVLGECEIGGESRVNQHVIKAIRSDGYTVVCSPTHQGPPVVITGSDYFTFDEARERWADTKAGTRLGDECLELVDYLESMARDAGWLTS